MGRGCSLDDTELDAISAERGAGSGATCASDCDTGNRNDGLPLSWKAAKAACGSGGCAEGHCNGSGAAVPTAPPQTCMKCHDRAPQVSSRQGEALCAECLWNAIISKVRYAVRHIGAIKHGDRVAVALSGGPCSRALLHCLLALRNPSKTRPARGATAFDMEVVHVDEGAAWGHDAEALAAAVGAVRASALRGTEGHDVGFHAVGLEDVFYEAGAEAEGGNRGRRRRQLADLAVKDKTGKEDLVAALQRALLLRRAAALGCNKVALGCSATRLAAHIVATVSKGSGYALPADLQYLDARHGTARPTLVLPVKDVAARDLALVCHFRQLPLAPLPLLPSPGKPSLNVLADEFVDAMQAGVPSAISTIVRTASKLQAFTWNQADTSAAARGEPLCCICNAPLADAELSDLATAAAASAEGQLELSSTCCRSCRQQVLVHLQPGAAAEPAASPSDGSQLPALPQHVLLHSEMLRGAARHAVQYGVVKDHAENSSSGSAGGGKHGMSPEQLRRCMRDSIADLLLDDSDGE